MRIIVAGSKKLMINTKLTAQSAEFSVSGQGVKVLVVHAEGKGHKENVSEQITRAN